MYRPKHDADFRGRCFSMQWSRGESNSQFLLAKQELSRLTTAPLGPFRRTNADIDILVGQPRTDLLPAQKRQISKAFVSNSQCGRI